MRERIQPLLVRLRAIAHYLTTGTRRKILTTALILLTFAVIARIIIQNRETFTAYQWQFNPIWLLYTILLFIIDLFIALYAWHNLVAHLANYTNLRNNFLFSLRSNLAKRIPGSVWVIASRAVLYQEVGVSKTTTALLSGLEIVFFIVSGLITALLTLPFWTITHSAIPPVLQRGLLFLSIPLSLLFIHPTIFQYIWQTISKTKLQHTLNWRDTIRLVLLYIATWLIGGGILFTTINLFHPYPVEHLPMIIGIWSLATTISLIGFLSISFIGLREISLGLLLTPILPTPVVLIVAISIRLLWVTGELVSALIALKL